MLKQTTQLFIKALIIGILVNLTLQQASAKPVPSEENTSHQYERQHLLKPLAEDDSSAQPEK
jgi:hypothetical protein